MMLHDLRLALRLLRKSPSFTLTALLALALGIGAATSIFTVVDAVLLRPLPYPEPDRLAIVWRKLEVGGGLWSLSAPEYTTFARESRTLSRVTGMRFGPMNLAGDEGPRQVQVARVSTSFFDTVGVTPMLGRAFEARDEKSPVVVLSHALWKTRYGGDRAIVGRTITIDAVPRTVIGVAPPRVDVPLRPDVWLPLAFTEDELRSGAGSVYALGRLAPGQTSRAAETELSAILARLRAATPSHYDEIGAAEARLVLLEEQLIGDASRWMLMLAAAVALVMIIACANVAGLLLARSSARRREIAVRVALGAGPSAIARQLLVESCVLAALGGALGVLLAVWGVDLLVAIHPDSLPRASEIAPDGRALLFALALSLSTGLAFGVVPALRAARTPPSEALKEGARGTSRGRARRALVTAQIAVAVVLLGGAGQVARSMQGLLELTPGTSPERVLTARIRLPEQRYPDDARRAAFFDALLARLERAPGIEAASVAWVLPFAVQGYGQSTYEIEGKPKTGLSPVTAFTEVGPRFFETMGLSIVAGRPLGADDRAGAPTVAVVSQTFARALGEDPIGKRVVIVAESKEPVTVVGVAADMRSEQLDREPTPMVYLASAQLAWATPARQSMAVLLRGEGRRSIPVLAREVAALDPDLPLAEVMTVEELAESSLGTRRFAMILLAVFAAVALLLAAIGTYGVISYSAAQRTREIGIRIALGAHPAGVTAMILREALSLAGVGVVLGIGLCLPLGRDPLALGTAAAVLVLATLVAAVVPARRAARVSPMTALGAE